MRNLYITDLKRILKDKLFLIAAILAGVFALINPLLNKILFSALELEDFLDGMMNAKSMFFGAFLPGDNLGLVMPILISIIVCKDFSHGTVRNKIISGKSRGVIFLSHFLSSASVMCVLMLAHALLTLAFSLCFFPYQSEKFTMSDFGYLLLSLLFEMIVYLAIAAIVTFIATLSKNMGICILLYLALSFGLSIIGSVFMTAGAFLDKSSSWFGIVEFINALNFFTSSLIGSGVTYTAKDVLYILLSPILTIAGSLALGIHLFSRKDLK
ncbi:MAG: hypothetical protein IKC72_07735 [Clostridia bacterium]|nr:hypothetical protein [Clostridia bacterium]